MFTPAPRPAGPQAGDAELIRGLAEWVFKPIAERREEFPNALVGFCPLRGSRYRGELMVVGRAGNGWVDEADPKELPNTEVREELARKLSEVSMSWVTDYWSSGKEYNTHKSAFWRVIQRVTLQLVDGASEDDWPTHLVWSNLYKVALQSGGNPHARLQYAQRDGCKELLNLEIKTFRPKRVLLLTGWNWADKFVCAPPEAREPTGARFVDRVWNQPLVSESRPAITRFVVARHPQGKNEQRWTDEVLEGFR